MATIPPKLTLAPYLQRWDAKTNTLSVHLLVMPTGNPLNPLGFGANPGPPFAECKLVFKAFVSKNWGQMPGFSEVDTTEILTPSLPANRHVLFNELAAQFNIKEKVVPDRSLKFMVRKHLMSTYTNSFAFVTPKTKLASTDDTYACLVNCMPKNPPTPKPIYDSVSWSEVLSFALRQPRLARELGIVYELDVQINPTELLKNGGWLFIGLDASSDYGSLTNTVGFLKVFGTRIPALKLGVSHQLFTPVLFPVVDDPTVTVLPGNFDEAFLEASRFNDGFAKIVHGGQAKYRNHLEEGGNGPAPIREEGIQLAWDDEDILIAQNRQIGYEPETMSMPAEAPMGVVGYRIDVREEGETDWHSLSKVTTDQFLFAGINFGAMTWESRTEVFPSIIQEQFWLPSYFTRWKGSSLVVTDPDDMLLIMGRERVKPLYYRSEDANEVPLLYGKKYEFRVRMVDTTNGGPVLDDQQLIPGESSVCNVHFKRFVRPGPVRWPEQDPDPQNATLTHYTISRPRIDLPQALYTAYPNVYAELLAIQKGNRVPGVSDVTDPSVPDIDTPILSIRVLVRVPDFDPYPLGKDNEGYVEWYKTTRLFPADLNSPYELDLKFTDCALLSDIDISVQTSPNPNGSLPIPTARDVKIELRAEGEENYDYFGNERSRLGAISTITLHKLATSEVDFLLPQAPQNIIRSIFLQPTNLEQETQPTAVVLQNQSLPVLVQRLAGAVGLVANDTTLLMPPGERGIFGCSKGLKHYLPANNSSLVLMEPSELANQWINVLHWEINRDWTWKGFAGLTFKVERQIHLNGNSYSESRHLVGEVRMMHAVTPLIAEEESPNRDSSHFVFIDSFQPPLGTDGKPYEVQVEYFLTVLFENGDTFEGEYQNHLPIAIPPRQKPKVVSAGIALSPYTIGEGYASTGERRKMLWLEFEEAPIDNRDAYFVRALTKTADPMLLQHYQALSEPSGYEQWSLNPELIRVISPGQADDFAGMTAMQRLIPAQDSDRHYLVPLPPGTYPDSPELFGFYTYEIRVGHDRGTPISPFWSTAQARFGSPVVLDGVQHPCPPLRCSVLRVKSGILASAAYAQAFQQGTDIQAMPPNTQIWYVLYAQINQADGSTMRNVELDKRLGRILSRREVREIQKITGVNIQSAGNISYAINRQASQNLQAPIQGHALWQQSEIVTLLENIGLPEDTPLSILGVELLPEPNGSFTDPLGADVGQVRILRTSALYPVGNLCC
ncbi:hypothetical protein P4414_04135 [Bacillus thuringiensis]|nr:hypothetical protein [Bacillus thuringiensis]